MRRYNVSVLLASLVIPLFVAIVNYWMDPLWCFDVSHPYNQVQEGFNERLQKTNYITYRTVDYEGVLIGSSRSVTIDPPAFRGIRVFNYSSNGLGVDEYPEYLEYFSGRNRGRVQYIFIGLDFNLVSGKPPIRDDIQQENLRIMTPAAVISDVNNPLNRLKTLISLDTLKYSYKNYRNYREGANAWYDRNLIKINKRFSPEILDTLVAAYMSYYRKNFSRDYLYGDKYMRALRKIRDDNPHAILIPYTTPIIDPLMKLVIANDALDNYYRWLDGIVDIFGHCYNFMHPSRITRDYHDYFVDPVHTTNAVGEMMADVMSNRRSREIGEFGMYIDRANIQVRKKELARMFGRL